MPIVSTVVSTGGPSVVIPLIAIPSLALALASAMLAGLGLVYWTGHWGPAGRRFLRAAVARTVFWTVASLWMASPSAAAAAVWWHLYLPAALLMGLSLLERALDQAGVTPPRGLMLPGLAAAAWLVASALPGAGTWYPGLVRLADGLWLGVAAMPLWLALVVDVGFGGLWLALTATALWGVWKQRRVHFAVYLALLALVVVVFARGGAFSTPPVLLPPYLWVGGYGLAAVLWYDLRTLSLGNHSRLNRDALTGAASRGYGERFGEERLAQGPLGAVYVDLDRFKAVNDRLGHDAGDRLLRETVVRLQSACRAGDLVVRLGGDEMAVFYSGVQSEDGARLLQRIRSAVAGPPPILAMSLGWSWVPQGTRLSTLLAAADDAMYEDKRLRRTPLASSGSLG